MDFSMPHLQTIKLELTPEMVSMLAVLYCHTAEMHGFKEKLLYFDKAEGGITFFGTYEERLNFEQWVLFDLHDLTPEWYLQLLTRIREARERHRKRKTQIFRLPKRIYKKPA